MRRAHTIVCLMVLLVSSLAPRVHAQVIEIPRFSLGGSSAGSPSVAVGLDGTIMFLWSESTDPGRVAFTRRFAATGTPLAAKLRVDQSGWPYKTGLSATPSGGYVGTWHYQSANYSSVYGVTLNALGARVGHDYEVGVPALIGGSVGVAGLPSGPVFFWNKLTTLFLRMFDESGAPRSGEVEIGSGWTYSDVAPMPGGGFVIVWWGFTDGAHFGRVYDAAGIAQGPEPFLVSDEFVPMQVATGPAGDIVVTGHGVNSGTDPGAVWFRRFLPDGTPAGAAVSVHAGGPNDFQEPDVELDEQGNVLVAWTAHDLETGVRPPPRARGYGPDDQPLGPAIDLDTSPGSDMRVAHIPNGGFVGTWSTFSSVYGTVVSLCTPGTSVCGDGAVHPQCEQCDDGVFNSDSEPGACRTDCTRARCRDGVVDGGESCDDGNLVSCDGCNLHCESELGLTCGDGITNPTCGQHCDDTNATVGDGCSPTCALERIPGGGSAKSDCLIEWQVNNPVNLPFLDKRGAINQKQQCTDDDPQCDFDGGVSGGCTFRVRVCANNTDVAGCEPGTRLRTWKLTAPSENKAAKDPAMAAVRASFASEVPGAVVGPGAHDICSDDVLVRVPLRLLPGGAAVGKLKLTATASVYDGRSDKDMLRLTCLPPTP